MATVEEIEREIGPKVRTLSDEELELLLKRIAELHSGGAASEGSGEISDEKFEKIAEEVFSEN